MTMTIVGGRKRRRPARPLALPAIVLGAAGAAAIFVGYVLWPRWPGPGASVDAPTLPVTVAGVAFNVPTAAIRANIQRKPGAHDRLDLVVLWPSLTPPDALSEARHADPEVPLETIRPHERLFVTIAGAGDMMPAAERIRTIYPRYLATDRSTANGIMVVPFRDGSPYQGEDLVYDPSDPDGFSFRCTRQGPAGIVGTCRFERRIGEADITIRFQRNLLSDWRAVASGIDRLIAMLHPRADTTGKGGR